MSEVAAFINDVGFPVFVAVFVLLRLEVTMRKTAEVMAGVQTIIGDCEARKKRAADAG